MAFKSVDIYSNKPRNGYVEVEYLRLGKDGGCALSQRFFIANGVSLDSPVKMNLEIDAEEKTFRFKLGEGSVEVKNKNFRIPAAAIKVLLQSELIDFSFVPLSSVFFILEKSGDYFVPVKAVKHKPKVPF